MPLGAVIVSAFDPDARPSAMKFNPFPLLITQPN